MAGWFYPPPPQPQTLVPAPVNATPWTNIPPNPIGPGTQRAAIVAAWPQESWPAQSGAIVSSRLAQAWANPPPPQPFYGTRALDVAFRQTWPPEDWPTQKLIGGGVGALVATPFVLPVAVATVNPEILALLRFAWPQEDWRAQSAGTIASLFAQVVNPPVIYPAPSRASQMAQRSLWLPEDWRAQSEPGVASGLAQLQLPPIYIPRPFAPQMALLRSLWPAEDWPAQTGPKSAGWYPPTAAYTPRAVPHWEWQSWPPEQWAAQTGARIAGLLTKPSVGLPFVNAPLLAALRASWPPEDWSPQRAATIASLLAVVQPPLIFPYSTVPQFPISQWLPESWAAQRGAVSPWLLPPPPFPGVLVWTAIYQLVNAGFVPYVTYATDPVVPAEFVISQSLAAGTVTGVPQVVTLVVSTGSAAPQGLTAVPSVIGLFARDATVALQAAFLSIDRYLWQVSTSAEGTVVAQSIAPNSVVTPGTILQLTLSAGPARVPPTLTVPLVH